MDTFFIEMRGSVAFGSFSSLTVSSSSSSLFSVGSSTGFKGRSQIGIRYFHLRARHTSHGVDPLRTRGPARLVIAKLRLAKIGADTNENVSNYGKEITRVGQILSKQR